MLILAADTFKVQVMRCLYVSIKCNSYTILQIHILSICYVPQSHMYAYTCKCRWDVVLWCVGIYHMLQKTTNVPSICL